MAARKTKASGEKVVPMPQPPLRVAVTGATGTVGQSLVRMLEDEPRVGSVLALARHRHDPDDLGWRRTEVTQLDVRDRAAVGSALARADVVVHLAFQIFGFGLRESGLFEVNVRGTRNVARATVVAGAKRFVYTSSAVVYGTQGEEEGRLSEGSPTRPLGRHFYSRHKAQAEQLVERTLAGRGVESYVFRPCGIAGPHAAGAVFNAYPGPLVGAVRSGVSTLARLGLRPAVFAPPVPVQLVHEDDVAAALLRAVRGDGPAGVYNLAPADALPGAEAVELLGLRRVPLPAAVARTAIGAMRAAPPLPPALAWQEVMLSPLLLDIAKAGRDLGWAPRHSSREALAATRAAAGI